MTEDPPRLLHNRTLADAYIATTGVVSRFAPVSEQVEVLPLEKSWLFPFGYNPTIIDHDGAIYMAYRYHPDIAMTKTKLAAARLSESGKVEQNWTLNVEGHCLEDPKFFRMDNQIWMSWVESWFPVKPIGSVRYGCFHGGDSVNGNIVREKARAEYGQNDGDHLEKNWVFFKRDAHIYFIYRQSPKLVVVQWSGQCDNEFFSDMPHWAWGEIKGGTAPVEYEGKLLRFAHSTLECNVDKTPRRYYVLALLHDPEPPFRVVAMSKKPVIYGNEACSVQREDCPHYKQNVVFPGGLIARDGYWLLALGANDCEAVIAKLKPEDLHL